VALGDRNTNLLGDVLLRLSHVSNRT
jgi:hypothetical protein